jgi:hypothetical protein
MTGSRATATALIRRIASFTEEDVESVDLDGAIARHAAAVLSRPAGVRRAARPSPGAARQEERGRYGSRRSAPSHERRPSDHRRRHRSTLIARRTKPTSCRSPACSRPCPLNAVRHHRASRALMSGPMQAQPASASDDEGQRHSRAKRALPRYRNEAQGAEPTGRCGATAARRKEKRVVGPVTRRRADGRASASRARRRPARACQWPARADLRACRGPWRPGP